MSFVGYIPDRTEERRKEKMYFDRVWESWTPEEKAEWLKRQKESEKFAEMFMGVFFLVTGIA
ncbi:MAG: hypothetical protein LBR34_08685, partial [Prevotella sp.]|nr:hypothetical protein [Prevotella sp.]